MKDPGHLLRLLWLEGASGFRERLVGRSEARARRSRFRDVSFDSLQEPPGSFPVLDVLAVPLDERFGGVPIQLAARLEEEATFRPTALLSWDRTGWRLELARGDDRRAARVPGPDLAGPPEPSRAGVKEMLVEVALRIGARTLNVEGAAGWPPSSLREAARDVGQLVLSLHDFSLYCPRPHLIEEPAGRFCDFSADDERCARCLSALLPAPTGFSTAWRLAGAELLAEASAVVYPSRFLLEKHAELFPAKLPRREIVIEPSGSGDRPGTRRPCAPPRHVAFAGSYQPHKGALLFEETVRRLGRGPSGTARWSIFGEGDLGLLARAKRLGVAIRGYYRPPSLPSRLVAKSVDLVLLLSIGPETFGLTLSDCRAAGIPVLALGFGAIGERVASEGGGILVDPGAGVEGVAAMVRALLSGEAVTPPWRPPGPVASPRAAALARQALYAEIGERGPKGSGRGEVPG